MDFFKKCGKALIFKAVFWGRRLVFGVKMGVGELIRRV